MQELEPRIERHAQTERFLDAPSVRFSFFAILPAVVLFRASVFRVRTSSVVQERRIPFFMIYLSFCCEARRLGKIRSFVNL